MCVEPEAINSLLNLGTESALAGHGGTKLYPSSSGG